MMNKELMGGVKKFLGKMQKSDEFRRFIHKNPDAFLCSGFFVIDNEGKDNKIHFDYYCPKSRKMFSFEMENEWRKADLEIVNNFVPSELLVNYDITFENLERLIDDKMNESNIKNKVQKMIFSLQAEKTVHGLQGLHFYRQIWVLSSFWE